MARVRLDSLLTERGLFASRTLPPRRSWPARCTSGGARAGGQAGAAVPADVEVSVEEGLPYVSRGGVKLANALDALGIEVGGRRALDVGASTGGFTDCLLQREAAHVVAVDVAYGELGWRLRSDERVTVVERVNARALEPGMLPYAPDLIVIDVSFISLTKVLPAVLACAAARYDCLAMVKPQFELGRGRVGKGGVVHDPALRREAIASVAACGRSWARWSWATPRRGFPARPGTARRSCGWPRRAAAGRGPWTRSTYEGGIRVHAPAVRGDRAGDAGADAAARRAGVVLRSTRPRPASTG